ncbi:uncharacterized protein TNCV_4419561 [Trichonephila clavipes]|nr:uncharacterized protein TNCV_4419561 [Trichonephila clavipes]
MDVCKCIVPSWPGGTSNSRRATSPLVRLVEGEERPSREREVVDDLAKAATSNPVDPEDHMLLTSTEIYSRAKELICRTWVVPPVHPWYFQRHPGSAISFKGSRSYQTAFSRFSTGHLKCMNFEDGKRSFPICPKCNISPFSPQHILQCLGFSCEEAVASFLLFLELVRIYGLMDLV